MPFYISVVLWYIYTVLLCILESNILANLENMYYVVYISHVPVNFIVHLYLKYCF